MSMPAVKADGLNHRLFWGWPMSVLVSACLLGVHCRYDGGHCHHHGALDVLASDILVPVCPEQLGGLPTPRPPADIAHGEDVLDGASRVLTARGEDVTEQYLRGAREVLRLARIFQVTKALMKQRSPSCGCGQISRQGRIVSGDGVTAALLKRKGIQITPL
jgi:uncharacterized protein YbbK (DUF523 family)